MISPTRLRFPLQQTGICQSLAETKGQMTPFRRQRPQTLPVNNMPQMLQTLCHVDINRNV